jgi:hypothetical protein
MEVFRVLGQQLGEHVNAANRARHGPDWFDRLCKRRTYRPNLYDPEFLLKEPDEPDTWCHWCMPRDPEFHSTRRRLKKHRNRWAHFEDFPPEDLASFLADVRRLATSLDLPMSSFLPRLQEHVRYLVDHPDVVCTDQELEELRSQIETLKEENAKLRTQVAAYDHWFPRLGVINNDSDPNASPDLVCLHFMFDGMEHSVRAQRIPGGSGSTGLAEIQFQMSMEIPLGEGDVVSYKQLQGGTCGSLTAIVTRVPKYRVRVAVDYGPEVLEILAPFIVGQGNFEVAEKLLVQPGGPLTRWNDFWSGFVEIMGEAQSQCAVVSEEMAIGAAVLEVGSAELATQVMEAAQLQDFGDGWILSTPDTPYGSLSSLDRFNYQVASERLTAEAISRGWYADADKRSPDLNRVLGELQWEPVSDIFLPRTANLAG